MDFRNLIYEKKNGVVTISLNRPEVRNAIDVKTRSEFLMALENAEKDYETRVVVIRGRDQHFSSGGSIKDIEVAMGVFVGRAFSTGAMLLVKKIYEMEKPIIAAVDGYAVGAGFSLVLASDLAISTDRAMFSQVFIKLGLTPDYGSCYFLPRAVGLKKAKEMAFTGKMISASEALALGIVNKVVVPAELDEAVRSMAEGLAKGPANAISLTKRLFNRSWELNIDTMFEFELMATSMCFQTEDHKEGVTAFLKKRKPLFRGR